MGLRRALALPLLWWLGLRLGFTAGRPFAPVLCLYFDAWELRDRLRDIDLDIDTDMDIHIYLMQWENFRLVWLPCVALMKKFELVDYLVVGAQRE